MQGVQRLSPFRIFLGLALLVAGILLIADQAGGIDAEDEIERWWPVILIALGIVQAISDRRVSLGALVAVLAGAFLLLITLDVISGEAGAFIWPVALVIVGIWILLGRSIHRRYEREDTVRSYSAFGGADIVQSSEQFAGGTLVQLFGGTTLDLRQAELAPEGASIDALAAFGGVDIIIPRGWRVAMSGIPIFGGYSIPTSETGKPAPGPAGSPLLSINVLVAFGGVDVKYEQT